MRYSWDEVKNAINIRKHGLSFIEANLVYEAPVKLTLSSKYEGNEERWIDMAKVNGNILLFVYTIRGGTIRCISLRKASRKERRLYDAYIQQ
jgi:uncharacterized DUF497 family protein